MTTTTEPDSEAAFLKWASTYARVEEDRGRTTWDDMRAAFMAGRAGLDSVREYRIYVDEDGDGIRMHGPCAETIGCLFGRLFDAYPSMREDISLGQVIDAALEHERDKEQVHADQMRSEQEPAGPPAGDGDFWSSGPSLVELDAYGDFAPGRRDPDKAADEE